MPGSAGVSGPTMISPSTYYRAGSMNGSMTKEQAHALKRFLTDMKNKNFDEIRGAVYRAAAKLYFIQKASHLHLVDIYNVIEAFRENGLNTLDHTAELDEPRLECIIASIYYALYKRLPSTKDIDIERCILVLTQWIMHVYDSEHNGRIRVLSIKTALSTMCSGRLIDKLRYVFTQISEANGILNIAKLDAYLRELLALPCSVGEEPNFGYSEDVLESFFKPKGSLVRAHTVLEDFLDAFLVEKTTGVLYWLHMFTKLSKAGLVEHAVQCKGCGEKSFVGLRYKCVQCYNYQMCQDCYWRGKVAGSHKADHDMQEYSTWNKGEKGTSVTRKLLCSPSKAPVKLPDYPKEPEPNKRLDMSNIVPPLPYEERSPPATLTRTPRMVRTSSSQHSNLSRTSSQASHDAAARVDDEHRLIAMYAQRLAANSLKQNGSHSPIAERSFLSEPSQEQKDMLTNLEKRNRTLLLEIRELKAEHEAAVKDAQQMGCDPGLLTELQLLRQRKEELEMRMSALQETRRDLMVQLEGLMKLLKSNQMNSPRSLTRVASSVTASDDHRAAPQASPNPTASSTSIMSGVNGDVKEAFGRAVTKEAADGLDLRADLLLSVDDITGTMRDVVAELTEDELLPPPDQKYGRHPHDLDAIMDELTSAGSNLGDQRASVRVY